jgi:hypothetical protein
MIYSLLPRNAKVKAQWRGFTHPLDGSPNERIWIHNMWLKSPDQSLSFVYHCFGDPKRHVNLLKSSAKMLIA